MYLLYSSLLSDDDRWTWPLNEIHKNRFFCWNFLAFVARRHYFPDVDAIRGQKPAEKPPVTISFCLWGGHLGCLFPCGGPSRRPSCSAGRDWTLALWLHNPGADRWGKSGKVPGVLSSSKAFHLSTDGDSRRPAPIAVSKDAPAVKESQEVSDVMVWMMSLFVCAPMWSNRNIPDMLHVIFCCAVKDDFKHSL